MKQIVVYFFAIFSLFALNCAHRQSAGESICPPQGGRRKADDFRIQLGAERFSEYLPLLEGKRVGLVVNQASRAHDVLLPDTLQSLGVDLRCIFVPEHGFRATADAGAYVEDGRDEHTGLPIISLYGKTKEPPREWMDSLDVLLFDLQDVGVRFYTYLSTLHYCLEACAKSGTPMLLLDRPNPNIRKLDGPVLDTAFSSFVGMHPVPLVYGMTIGEYAQMIIGEGWLKTDAVPDLKIIPCAHYTRDSVWVLPRRPSPNLPTERSILLYPSLALFEGTVFSVGRGTSQPFECFGVPGFPAGNFTFKPEPKEGARHPKHEGVLCRGMDLSELPIEELRQEDTIRLEYLLFAWKHYEEHGAFFLPNHFFDLLAGTDALRKQVLSGASVEDIRASWEEDLEAFRQMRKPYLIYD